jgi:hypothetical protein
MWRPMELDMARRRYGLTNGLMVRRELSSEIALRAFNISITTRTDRDKVDAFTFPSTKYLHGSFCKSIPSIKLAGANSSLVQVGH